MGSLLPRDDILASFLWGGTLHLLSLGKENSYKLRFSCASLFDQTDSFQTRNSNRECKRDASISLDQASLLNPIYDIHPPPPKKRRGAWQEIKERKGYNNLP